MGKNLVIVESPAKAKTIENYLGSDYVVLSSVGHIRDLATTGPGGLGVDVEDHFKPNYKNRRADCRGNFNSPQEKNKRSGLQKSNRADGTGRN